MKAEQIVRLKLAPVLSSIPRRKIPPEPARPPQAEALTPATTTNTTVLPQPESEPANVAEKMAAPGEQSLAAPETYREQPLPVPDFPPPTLTEKPIIRPRLDSIAGLAPFKSAGKRPLAEGGGMKPLPSQETIAQGIPNTVDIAKMPDYTATPTAATQKPYIPAKLSPAAEFEAFRAIDKPALAKNKAEGPAQSADTTKQEIPKAITTLVSGSTTESFRQSYAAKKRLSSLGQKSKISSLLEPLPGTAPHLPIPPLSIPEPIDVATLEAEAPYGSLKGTSTPAEMPISEQKASSSASDESAFAETITDPRQRGILPFSKMPLFIRRTGNEEGAEIDGNEPRPGSTGGSTIIRPMLAVPPTTDPDPRENPALPGPTAFDESPIVTESTAITESPTVAESTTVAEPPPESSESIARARPDIPPRSGPDSHPEAAAAAPQAEAVSAEEALTRISALIAEKKTYPEAARLRRAEGTVKIGVSVRRDGGLKSLKIATRSGSAVLDRAASDLVKGLFPIPFNLATEIEAVVTIEYRLIH